VVQKTVFCQRGSTRTEIGGSWGKIGKGMWGKKAGKHFMVLHVLQFTKESQKGKSH